MDLPSLSKLSLSEPDRIQAQVGAGCDDDAFTMFTCDNKLDEWTEWLEQKRRDLASKNEATVESVKAIVKEYYIAGVMATVEEVPQRLSLAQQDLWVRMAARVRMTKSWPQLELDGRAALYDYMKMVALAWLQRHNTGELRVNAHVERATIGDDCGKLANKRAP